MKATSFRLIQAEQGVPTPYRIATEAQQVHDARIAAVRRLGRNWVRHPAYTFNPRHSNSEDVYPAARADFLAAIRRTAAADRARNPAFQQAERVRAVLGDRP